MPSLLERIFCKDHRLRPLLRALLYPLAVAAFAGFLSSVYFLSGGAIAGGRRSLPAGYAGAVLGEFLLAAAALTVALVMRRWLDRRSLESLGLPARGPWSRLFLIGVAFGAAMQILVYLMHRMLGYSQVVAYAAPGRDVEVVGAALVVFLVAALFEEISLRGYLLQNLWEEWGFAPAAVVTSSLFAVLHFSNPHAHEKAALTAGGLVLFSLWAAFSLLWTKSLWLVLGCHAAWNTFEGPIFGFPLSGLAMPVPSAVTQRISGPEWFTGGAFGPESGVSSMLALTLGFAVLAAFYRAGIFSDAADTRESYAKASELFFPSRSALVRS
ncbi:MAG: hypothetical protein DLM53_05605 [Candidatus Eremiobacter antarcticus]|nr:CPBP family intramembrane metalloprotease [Candidatus Eremiobacteraeota bacterium]MBC5806994.1 CPBP family intramembrane metalloprotease [Candidatus Eremiobacteraeota bacterium]PZR62873.1 MAG: hypothetical protein DLM53_05605 [Candidatus Eremiobacter sp. RRmetagenome_bin22]